jgi:molybdopterin-guanine dinucleotide biosynthesis protein A
MTPNPVVALVLAGGSARRMGGADKPLLELDGRSILARILGTLTPLPIAISANGDPARFASYGLPVLPDLRFAGQGPLAGLLAGLNWAADRQAEVLLTIPGDTPFVPSGLAASLAPAPACAMSLGRMHPLVAIWPVACRTALAAWLEEDRSRAVARFAASIGMRGVDFRVQGADPFLNVNTPDDLATASTFAGGGQARAEEPE